jgi:hypothetical protein
LEEITMHPWKLMMAATFAAYAAFAGPITFTMTTTGTGTFGGTPFSSAAITVTSTADTGSVFIAGGTPPDVDYEVIALTTTIDIAGFAPATFNDQTYWLDPNGSGDIIFGDVGVAELLGLTVVIGPLATYNLQSSLGPISSAFDFPTEAFNLFQNIQTSGGPLSLVAMNDTFTAVEAIPEPASLVLGGLGLLALLGARRFISHAA